MPIHSAVPPLAPVAGVGRQRRAASRLLVATVAALAFVTVACGGSDISKDQFEEELRTEADLTDEQAACVADTLYKNFDQSDINDLYTADSGEDLGEGVYEKFTDLIVECATGAG